MPYATLAVISAAPGLRKELSAIPLLSCINLVQNARSPHREENDHQERQRDDREHLGLPAHGSKNRCHTYIYAQRTCFLHESRPALCNSVTGGALPRQQRYRKQQNSGGEPKLLRDGQNHVASPPPTPAAMIRPQQRRSTGLST